MSRLAMPSNPRGLVYGTILVATLLAAEPPRRETYARTVAAVAVAMIVYWLATSYAEFTGDRVRAEEPFTLGSFVHTAVRELAVVYGALGPLLAVLVCWTAGAQLTTAVTIAVWTAVAIIIAIEIAIGIRAELTGKQLIVQTSMGVLLGLMVVALRVLLH
jgi:hypothetical protein